MTTWNIQKPVILGPDTLTDAETDSVLHGAVAAKSETAIVEVSGSGAVDCLQGLLTNDVEAPGDRAFIYGALLTPKGMIVSDMWIARTDRAVSISVPKNGKADVLETFKRSLPPRLASFADRSDELSVIRLVGPDASNVTVRADLAATEPGYAVYRNDCLLAKPAAQSPFTLQITCPTDRVDDVLDQLSAAGATIGDHSSLELERILRGWPLLGAEIDAKTLPQEVRFDDLGGVSHTKGCYVGQETVARIHFRGHVNRQTMGLLPESDPDFSQAEIIHDDRRVGRITSAAWMASLDNYVALCVIRREVEPGSRVTGGGVAANVVDLPFRLDTL